MVYILDFSLQKQDSTMASDTVVDDVSEKYCIENFDEIPGDFSGENIANLDKKVNLTDIAI